MERIPRTRKKTPTSMRRNGSFPTSEPVGGSSHHHRHHRQHQQERRHKEDSRIFEEIQSELQLELEEQMKEFRRRSKSASSSSKSPDKRRRRKSHVSPPPSSSAERRSKYSARKLNQKSKTVPAHRHHKALTAEDIPSSVTAKSSRAKDIVSRQAQHHHPLYTYHHYHHHRHQCPNEQKTKDEADRGKTSSFVSVRKKINGQQDYLQLCPPEEAGSRKPRSSRTPHHPSNHFYRHHHYHRSPREDKEEEEEEEDAELREQLERERREIQLAQQEKDRLQRELEKREKEHRRLMEKERQKEREELERKIEFEQREKERKIEIERKEQELREIINLKQQEDFERRQVEEREKRARRGIRDKIERARILDERSKKEQHPVVQKEAEKLKDIVENDEEKENEETLPKEVKGVDSSQKISESASKESYPFKKSASKEWATPEVEESFVKAQENVANPETERNLLKKEMMEKEKAARELADKERRAERDRKKNTHRRSKSRDYGYSEASRYQNKQDFDKKSRSLETRKTRSESAKRLSPTSAIKARTFSYDDELLQIRTFPIKKKKPKSSGRADTPMDSSPPCTCDDSDSNNQNTVLEMPVITEPPSAPPSWLLEAQRQSSAAQSCRSQGYASLGSSAGAYVEGITEDSDEWDDRRHQRTHSGGGGYSFIKEERHSSRCASFPIQDGDSDYEIQQHIRYCKCSCDHLGYGNYMDFDQRESTSNLIGTFQRDMNGGAKPAPRESVRPMSIQEQELTSDYRDFFRSKFGRIILCAGLKLRRQHWCFLGCILLIIVIIIGSLKGMSSNLPPESSSEKHQEIVAQLLKEVPLIDGHNDLPWNIRKFVHNKLDSVNFTHNLKFVEPWSKSKWSHTDISRMITGKIGCQLWVAYAPCGAQHKDAVQVTLEQIDLIKRLADQYPQLKLVRSSEELSQAHSEGKIASLITVESGHSIGTSLAVLRMFHRLGARSLTLTHNCNTPWADCSKADIPGATPEHNGLTQFGRTVVEEMNRLGMIVDLSHSSIQTARDTLAVSDAPVIFSHSSAQALCNSTRNIPDNLLRLLAEKKGLVMVNFFSYFLTCSNHSTVKDVIAHLSHIRRVAGIDHVGIGASYDGINSTPSGLEDVTKYPTLFASLLATGVWSLEDLKKLAGLNFLRVFREVERVSLEYYKQKPSEEVIPGKDLGDNTQCKTERKK